MRGNGNREDMIQQMNCCAFMRSFMDESVVCEACRVRSFRSLGEATMTLT